MDPIVSANKHGQTTGNESDLNMQYKAAMLDFTGKPHHSEEFQNAFKQIRSLAEKGNSDALTTLGVIYVTGQHCNKDDSAAFRCFKDAAKSGHLDALILLVGCYQQGIGVPVSVDDAGKNLHYLTQEILPDINIGKCSNQGERELIGRTLYGLAQCYFKQYRLSESSDFRQRMLMWWLPGYQVLKLAAECGYADAVNDYSTKEAGVTQIVAHLEKAES